MVNILLVIHSLALGDSGKDKKPQKTHQLDRNTTIANLVISCGLSLQGIESLSSTSSLLKKTGE
jgi:hypothetical protein